ncbi:MAG: tRNA lysidine(34) synthetase TilS, partial [Acutalibacteraceae bacterium]
MKNELLDRVANTMREYDMRPMSGKILIALSGGADSVALTHMLIALSPRLKLELFAVHLNHNLRGEESARDERFVRDFCKRLSIPLTVYSEDIAAGAADSRRGIEEYARERRYALFGALAEETGAYLATAHHLNDVAETLIFNISRGCGI